MKIAIPTPAELMAKMGSAMQRHDWTNADRHLLHIVNGLTNDVMKASEELVAGKEIHIQYMEASETVMNPLAPLEYRRIEDRLALAGWRLKSVTDFRNRHDSSSLGNYHAVVAVMKVDP